MAERALIIGTRGSRLALAQAHEVRDRLQGPSEVRVIRTSGDRFGDASLRDHAGQGFFTKEIEQALLDGRADFAVHSLKDLPTGLPDGLALAAVTERVDPRDVLVSRSGVALGELPEAATIGTSSLRRSAQLAHFRPDLQFVPIRGNVETRLRKLHSEGLDAIVLAGAGLLRLGLERHVTQWLPTDICLPAAGQGILGLQTRADDDATSRLLAPLACETATVCATAERAALARLGAGCQTPAGFLAQISGDECVLEGVVLGVSGRPRYRERVSGDRDDASALGEGLAERLLATGAGEVIA